MTLEEKLDNFYTSTIDSATRQNIDIVKEYEQTLQKIYTDRKQDAVQKAEATHRAESDQILREKNRMLSNEITEVKRRIIDRTTEITDRIFDDVNKKLEAYMKTPAYEELLCKEILAANNFARGGEITIYINPSDEIHQNSLETKTGAKLTISNRDFIGGIRAVVPANNVLIDQSFLTKLEEAKNSFTL